jgi:hypothetical protein
VKSSIARSSQLALRLDHVARSIQRIAGTGPEYPSVGSAAPGAGTSGIFFSVTTFMTLFLF